MGLLFGAWHDQKSKNLIYFISIKPLFSKSIYGMRNK
jgi:hypothetical protein